VAGLPDLGGDLPLRAGGAAIHEDVAAIMVPLVQQASPGAVASRALGAAAQRMPPDRGRGAKRSGKVEGRCGRAGGGCSGWGTCRQIAARASDDSLGVARACAEAVVPIGRVAARTTDIGLCIGVGVALGRAGFIIALRTGALGGSAGDGAWGRGAGRPLKRVR